MESFDRSALNAFVDKYKSGECSLIATLQDIQGQYGYLPQEALSYLSTEAGIPLSRIFCTATFYSSFSLEPRGKHLVSVCLGTACHVKNGDDVLNKLGRDLGLDACDGTTVDRTFTLEKVRCMGCCSMAPVVRINNETYGNVTQNTIPRLLERYRKAEKR